MKQISQNSEFLIAILILILWVSLFFICNHLGIKYAMLFISMTFLLLSIVFFIVFINTKL